MMGSRNFWKMYAVFNSVVPGENNQLNTGNFTIAGLHMMQGQDEGS